MYQRKGVFIKHGLYVRILTEIKRQKRKMRIFYNIFVIIIQNVFTFFYILYNCKNRKIVDFKGGRIYNIYVVWLLVCNRVGCGRDDLTLKVNLFINFGGARK